MRVVQNENTWFFDCDDTLVLWDERLQAGNPKITINDPHLDTLLELEPNYNNITLLKEKSMRGCHVVVWSQGGWAWALAVVEALKLTTYVDCVMTKPAGVVDDLPVDKWMPVSFTMDAKKRYKS